MTTGAMKLVFRLNGIGFSLPVDHLVEICEDDFVWQELADRSSGEPLLGRLAWRDGSLPVFDLRGRLGLPPDSPFSEVQKLLVLSGRPGPWGIMVDGVEGIFPEGDFSAHRLPLLLQHADLTYRQLDLWRTEPLVCADAETWAGCWGWQ